MWLFILIVLIGIFNEHSNGFSDHSQSSLNNIPFGLKSVLCEDGNSSCPHNETCCQLESKEYGCCPFPDGVCCSDHLNCCPNDSQCDIERSRCEKEFKQSKDILCSEDDQMSCADGETSSKFQSGDSGCCPLPDAVDCNDFIHCCPNGYQCNVEEKKCEKGISIPWFTKKSAIPLAHGLIKQILLSPSTIQCYDDKSLCIENRTCCEVTNGSYGCCPYGQASCCSDKIHCCGEGYSCDQSSSKCLRHLSLIPLSIIEKETCQDGITKCSLSSTCCQNKDQTCSCCPYVGGVCCASAGLTCCPYQFSCDEEHSRCLNNTIHILCLDSLFQCPNGFCCRTMNLCQSVGPCLPGDF